ncbi:Uncharacterized protein TPAR_01428 [Tolypocladium paradoxum]|uniref:SH3 domain-containing protein n=1 Tax=Tolypocladium paradoxum TaxID=94208 RepID=A0A2S4L7G3_9HYPO|nr:Uncharacterized protein TPAR_01428 [Tolypocladium paradoxum]
MPHQHMHRHLHDRRDFINDVGDWIDKMNPFNPDNGSGRNSPRDEVGIGGPPAVRTIYKTMAPTFSGPIAGYSTLRVDNSPPPSSMGPKQDLPPTTTPKPEPTTTSQDGKTSSKSSMPTAIHPPSTSTSLDSVLTMDSILAKATGQASVSSTTDIGATPLSTSLSVPSSSPSAVPSTGDRSSDAGASPGAKAGIAFGVLGGLLLVGLLVFFLFNRRRKQAAERQKLDDDEKLHDPVGAGATPFEPMSNRSDQGAPRISLRPVTQFLPNWSGFDKRASKGAVVSLAPAAAAAATTRAPGGNVWDRPNTSQSTNPANPFGNQAERVPTSIIEEQSIHSPSSPHAAVNEKTPAPENAPVDEPLTANGPAIAAGAIAGTAFAAGVGVAALSRKTSMRSGGPKNVDLTLPPQLHGMAPPSPAGTEFSMSSVTTGSAPPPSNGAAAIAAAGGPQNSSVHRVQLDFKPTLEDEMHLRAGELVRLLHEYDDGWALAIRLDRSQQGVVPRTCLSTRPVKPRPPPGAPRPGPPINPNGHPRGPNYANVQRPMTPQGNRPMTPQGMPPSSRPGLPESPSRPRMGPAPSRPASPAGHGGRAQSPMGRPMSPGPRAQSPGPRHQGPPASRPQSPSGMNRRMSPPRPSPMKPTQSPSQEPPSGPPTGPVNRKPVPGQAY